MEPRTPGPELVDDGLIDEMLRLTPEERLRQNDALLRTLLELEEGVAAARGPDRPPR
jgi:hypothetical protein